MRYRAIAIAAVFGMSLVATQAQTDMAAPPATVVAPAAMDDGAAAPASASAPDSADVTTSPASDADTIVCRELPPPTGSRLGGRRICQSKTAWAEQAHRSQEEISAGQNRGGRSGGSAR